MQRFLRRFWFRATCGVRRIARKSSYGNRSRGFSLIQISILLAVASLLLVAVLPSLQSSAQLSKVTQTKMNTILTTLRGYEAANSALPCPADASQPTLSTTYGVAAANAGTTTNCSGGTPQANYVDSTNNVAVGMVPVRTLGLSNDYALDAFGRTITYAVDTNATSCFSTTLPGKITVTDNGIANSTIAALVSHGPNGHGAWIPLTGSSGTATRLNAGSTDSSELTNAHLNTSFVATTPLTNFVSKAPTSTFDDIVVYNNPLWTLNSPPVAASGAQAAVAFPANGTYYATQTLSFTVTFAQAVTVTGTPEITLNVGGSTRYATYSGGSGTTVLTFHYAVGALDSAPAGLTAVSPVNVNGGSITTTATGTTPCLMFTPPSASVIISPFAYSRTVTINSSQVVNANETNFPVLVSGTYSYLATAANGGNVQNSSGYDIIFTSDAAGTQILSFEQESYSATTGQVNYWIQVPTISNTTNTVIYMFYGNSAVTATESNKTGVWDSNFMGVWHLGNGSTLSATDSTSNGNNGAITGATATTGEIDGAASFNGSSNYISIPNSTSLNPTTGLTLSFWVYPGTQSSTWRNIVSKGTDGGTTGYGIFYNGSATTLAGATNTTPSSVVSTSSLPASTWTYLTLTYNGSTINLYFNAVVNKSASATGSIPSNTNHLYIGANASLEYYTGRIDEVRISNIARSANWISTEYNNQSSPSTFYTIGAATSR